MASLIQDAGYTSIGSQTVINRRDAVCTIGAELEAWVFRNRRDCCQKGLRPVGLDERWLETEQASESRRHFAPSVTRRRDERGNLDA